MQLAGVSGQNFSGLHPREVSEGVGCWGLVYMKDDRASAWGDTG